MLTIKTETRTEREFINFPFMLASLIDIDNANFIGVDIQGMPYTEKSLIADVVLHGLRHTTGGIDVPRQDHFSMEPRSSYAAHASVAEIMDIKARKMFVEFVRHEEDFHDFGHDEIGHISIMSRDFNNVSAAGIVIRMLPIGATERNDSKYWHRKWDVQFRHDIFKRDNLEKLIKQVERVNTRRNIGDLSL